MNHTDLYDDEHDEIEVLKRITLLLFRIYKWDSSYYSTLLELFSTGRLTTNPKYYFDADGNIAHYSKRPHEIQDKEYLLYKILYKKASISLQAHNCLGLEEQEIVFENDEEKDFYKSLPDDYEILIIGLYFQFLPHAEQSQFFCDIVKSLISRYKCDLQSITSKQEQTLLNEFRFLSKTNKSKVFDFISFLSK